MIDKKKPRKKYLQNFACRVFQSFLSIHTARHTLNGELAMPVGICRYLITRSPAMFTTERDSWSTLVHWWRPREGTWWTRRRDGSSTSMCAGTSQQVNQISTDLLRWYQVPGRYFLFNLTGSQIDQSKSTICNIDMLFYWNR